MSTCYDSSKLNIILCPVKGQLLISMYGFDTYIYILPILNIYYIYYIGIIYIHIHKHTQIYIYIYICIYVAHIEERTWAEGILE
jgi:hypothetical protein